MKFKKLGFKSLALIFTIITSVILVVTGVFLINPSKITNNSSSDTVEESTDESLMASNVQVNSAFYTSSNQTVTINYTVTSTLNSGKYLYPMINPMINEQVSGDGKYYTTTEKYYYDFGSSAGTFTKTVDWYSYNMTENYCQTANGETACNSKTSSDKRYNQWKMGVYNVGVGTYDTGYALYPRLVESPTSATSATFTIPTTDNLMTVSNIVATDTGVSFTYSLDKSNLYINTFEFAITTSAPTSGDWKKVNATDLTDNTISTVDYSLTLTPNTNYTIYFRVNGTVQDLSTSTHSFKTLSTNGLVTSSKTKTNSITNTETTIEYEFVKGASASAPVVTYSLYRGTNNSGTLVAADVATTATETESGTYEQPLTGLTYGTDYYIEFKINGVLQSGSGFTWRTTSTATDGSVSNIAISDVTNTNAKITYTYTGSILGGSDNVTYKLYEGTSSAGTLVSTQSTPVVEASGQTNTYSWDFQNLLKSNKNYYIELFVGTTSQGSATFTTTNNFDGVAKDFNATGTSNTSANITFNYTSALGTGSNAVTYTVYQGVDSTGTAVTNLTNVSYTATAGANSFNITSNLNPNTNYYIEFKVNGVVQGGDTFSTQNNFDGVITNITNTNVANTTATFTFTYQMATGTGSNAITYTVYQGTNNTGTAVTNLTNKSYTAVSGTNTLTISSNLVANTQYYIEFKVNNVVQGGTTFKTTNNFDGKATSITGTATSNTSVNVTYSYAVATGTGSNALTYSVYQGTNNSGTVVYSNVAQTPVAGSNTISISGLTINTQYYVEIKVNNVVQGGTTVTTQNNVDGKITSITALGTSNTAASFSFNYTMATGTGSNAVTYTIYRGTNNSGTAVTNQTNKSYTAVAGTNTFSVTTDLTINTQYYIEFKVNGVIQGGAQFTTQNNVDGKISNVTASGTSNTTATVSFDYVLATGTGSNAVTYTVYKGTNNTGVAVTNLTNKSYTATAGTNTFSITNYLTINTQYYIEFKVNNVVQGGAQFTTQNNVDAKVTSISAVGTSNTSANVTYTYADATGTGSNATTYTVYQGTSNLGTPVAGHTNVSLTSTVGSNTKSLTGLTINTQYYVEIKVNGVIQGGASFTTQNNVAATVNSSSVTSVNDNSATISYHYTSATGTGSTNVSYSLYQGTSTATGNLITSNLTTANETTTGNYSQSFTGLTANTSYIVQFSVGGVIQNASTIAFTTTSVNSTDATITNGATSSVGRQTATINYTFTKATGSGSNNVTFNLYEGSDTSNPPVQTGATPANEVNTGNYSITLSTLKANTDYILIFYVNGNIQKTSVVTFTTLV